MKPSVMALLAAASFIVRDGEVRAQSASATPPPAAATDLQQGHIGRLKEIRQMVLREIAAGQMDEIDLALVEARLARAGADLAGFKGALGKSRARLGAIVGE